MTNVNPQIDPMAVQRARAQRLRDLFEPWSIRRLATRTGLSKSVVASRLSGETPLNMPEFEILAPVVRMTPEELFLDLLAVADQMELPDLDSNQEPIVSEPAPEKQGTNVHPIDFARARRTSTPHTTPGTVTPIKQAMGREG